MKDCILSEPNDDYSDCDPFNLMPGIRAREKREATHCDSEAEYAERMRELKAQLFFNPRRMDKCEADYQERVTKELAYLERRRLNGGEIISDEPNLKRLRNEVLYDAMSLLDSLKRDLNSFPLRHRENLKASMMASHPEWRGKLDGILPLLGNGSIFILRGPRGTGKTQLAVAVARYLSESSYGGAEYMVLGELFTKIKSTFKTGSAESEDSILRNLLETKLLVLDECHEISGTEWQGRILTLLVDSRYRAKRDTVLITNHSREAFLASVGESITDRIAECGFLIECDWPSFRRARN